MPFIRVRDKSTLHEYDAPAREVAEHPEFYVVLDTTPVDQPRPAKHYIKPPAKPATRTHKSGGETKKEETK